MRADENENADLLWAIRGGGGNFGVVTALTSKVHPVSTVVAGPIIWPLDQAAEVLAWYREFLPAQPDEVNGFFAFLTVPPGPPFPEELHMQKVCARPLVASTRLPRTPTPLSRRRARWASRRSTA